MFLDDKGMYYRGAIVHHRNVPYSATYVHPSLRRAPLPTGGGYWFFNHSAWNGLTVADLVFPLFVFTQGLSSAISFASQRSKGARKRDLAAKVLVRSVKLYLLGLFVNNSAILSQIRLLGVLQYFAMANLALGLLEIFVPPLAQPPQAAGGEGGSTSSPSVLRRLTSALWADVGGYALQWAVMATLAAVYLCVEYLLPVPGCPTGYIGPGGLADNGAYPACTGGAHRYVDVSFFGVGHIYHNGFDAPVSSATCGSVYQCAVYDPEGALGWISAVWIGWLGLQAGRVIVSQRGAMKAAARQGATPAERRQGVTAHVYRWVAWGLACGFIGGGLCGFSKEEGLIPINKNMWSPSFVLVMVRALFTRCCLLFYHLPHVY